MKLVHKIFTAALLSSAALPGAAMAADAPPAVQAFLANLERQTAAKPSYDAIKDDGNGNVTITNLTLAKPAQGDNPSLTVKAGEANFSGITEEGPALWQIGKASFTNTSLEISSKDGSFKAKTAHTLNPVPLILFDKVSGGRLGLKADPAAGLSSIAATTANLLGYEKHPAWDDSVLDVK